MARADLFFGSAGGPAAWRHFLRTVVTPRFPDGLTVIDASGQWNGRHGLVREATRIVVIYYRRDVAADHRIEMIRTLYERRFRQTSVLRADSSACVSF